MFNTNLIEFFTGNTGANGQYLAGRDGSSVVSLPELLGAGGIPFGGNYAGTPGMYDSLSNTLMTNFKKNWVAMTMGVVLIPVAAKTVTKLIRKPVILPANRMLKSVGLDVKV